MEIYENGELKEVDCQLYDPLFPPEKKGETTDDSTDVPEEGS